MRQRREVEKAFAAEADTASRRRIAENLDANLLVEAAAGTGKTTSMVRRMTVLLSVGRCRIENLAAVTFTRKAAAELRNRFRLEMERLAAEKQGGDNIPEALRQIERAFIGTIHAFCARILRERPLEAGVDLDFREIDEREDEHLKDQSWSEYLSRMYASSELPFEALRNLGLEAHSLRESFFSFTRYPDVPHWPLPEDGFSVEPGVRRALRSYVVEMESLLPDFPVERGSDRLMERYERITRLARNRDLARNAELMEILELFDPGVKMAMKHWPGGMAAARSERDKWKRFCADIAAPASTRWKEARYAEVLPHLAAAKELYDRRRGEEGLLNYQDLLMKAARLLRERKPVREYFQSRFSHLLVDEFQDTDPVQAEVIMLLCAVDPDDSDWRRCTPRPGSLFLVGDPKQSIYRFRRADISTYHRVREIVLRGGGEAVTLSRNFRSGDEILGWANRLFRAAFPDKPNRYSPAAADMLSGRESHRHGVLSGTFALEIPEGLTRSEAIVDYEADFIARYIRRALDGGLSLPRSEREKAEGIKESARAEDFMIVTWQRRNLHRYARRLQQLDIAHRISGGGRLSEIVELRMLSDCMRAVSEPENPIALLAVLRGPLCGITDAELYAFRRSGGVFSFNEKLPPGLHEGTAHRLENAFGMLRRYAVWASRLPPVSSLEMIAADLGLWARALDAPGGDLRAGTMAKVLEAVRAVRGIRRSGARAAEALRELMESEQDFDEVPARSASRAGVLVLNLHRAKGLEAPVVFLADPTGLREHPVTIHVDRSGGEDRAYLALTEGAAGYRFRTLAHPSGWEAIAEEERRFLKAERTRLYYVAATRAGSMLIVSRRRSGGHRSPWDFFSGALDACPPLEDPGQGRAPSREEGDLALEEVEAAARDIDRRWASALRPSYSEGPMTKVALTPSELHRSPAGTGHGTEWGTVVHFLLEAAMMEPHGSLVGMARAALEQQSLPLTLAEEAVRCVRAVISSDLWRRARASSQVLVEVPVRLPSAGAGPLENHPGILRGVIDLVFRERGGWVVVDYKTDPAGGDRLRELTARYRPQVEYYAAAWEECTGEKVIEKGLYFTDLDRYLPVGTQSS